MVSGSDPAAQDYVPKLPHETVIPYLQHNRVPVSVLDPVQAVACVPVESLTSGRTSIRGCGEAGALGNLTNHAVNSITAACVAVAKEKNVLVGAVVSGIALLWKSRLLKMDILPGFIIS